MPELPEVETVRSILDQNYASRRIESLEVLYPKMIHSDVDEFKKLVPGNKIQSVTRYGKYLFINLENGYSIISHLRMEGKYMERSLNEELNKHSKVVFYLDNGVRLVYEDVRCFGIMVLTKTLEIFDYPEIKKLGKEPFSISVEELYEQYHKSNKEIKALLLDQTIMCGLGNIYADEVLFKAKINPLLKGKELTKHQVEMILNCSISILNQAIRSGGSTVSTYHPAKGVDGKFQNYLEVYNKKDEPCPICSTPLVKIKVGGRGTTYCPHCQKVATKSVSLAITGKIASGKSTALSSFKSLSCPTLSADIEVDKLYRDDKFKLLIVALFGEQVLNDNGTISKTYIKETIAGDTILKKKLEGLIYPLIRKKISDFIEENKSSPLVVVEVPLLYESHMQDMFDYVLGMDIDPTFQRKLLKYRTRSNNVDKDLKLNSNSRFDKNKKKMNFIIENNSDERHIYKEVKKIYESLTAL